MARITNFINRYLTSLALLAAVLLLLHAIYQIKILANLAFSATSQKQLTRGGMLEQTWDIGHIDKVVAYIHHTTRYELNTEAGAADYAQLIPPGGYKVYVDGKPKTLAMFHQMRCLDIIRREFVRRQAHPDAFVFSPLGEHCVNYVYQTTLCHASTRLESIRSHNYEQGATAWEGDYVCDDWERVYEEAVNNQNEFVHML